MRSFSLYISWLLALLGTLLSFYVSDILGFAPCNLCWYQRLCLFPLTIILGIAAYRSEGSIFRYAIAFPIAGSLIAFCQIVYQTIHSEVLMPLCGASQDCDLPSLTLFDWVTMPMLSFANFALITVFLFLSRKQEDLRK